MAYRNNAQQPIVQLKPSTPALPPNRPAARQGAVVRPVELSQNGNFEFTLGNTSPRFLRLRQILAPEGPIPVSKSTWWSWVNSGYAPAPHRISKRITVWRESDIYTFIESKLNKQL